MYGHSRVDSLFHNTQYDCRMHQSALAYSPHLQGATLTKNAQHINGEHFRYASHLQPKINHSEWSPIEDAQAYYLHSTMGDRWELIAELIPGRTCDNVQNRCQQIYQRVEKEILELDEKMLATASSTKIRVMERLTNYQASAEFPTTQVLKLVVHALRNKTWLPPIQYKFQFRLVACDNDNIDTICARCGLSIPSLQTGTQVCTKTGWCASCVRAPSYLSADILRTAISETEAIKNRNGCIT